MNKRLFKPSTVSALVSSILGIVPVLVQAAPTGNVNLDAINVSEAYEKGLTGAGVRIGILDSGFDTGHVAFAGRDIISIMSSAYETLYGEDPKWSEHNHGTHVAGIAAGGAAVDYGVARDASLLLLSSSLQAQTSIEEPVELYLKAFEAFDDVKIYSNSWGWVRGLRAYRDVPQETEAFNRIFSSAVEKDKLLVFAAGNQAGLAPGDPILDQMRDPTNNGHILNVVNIESDHLFEQGKFVHPNTTIVEGSNMGLFAGLWTIAAPGTNIVSAAAGTTDGTVTLTGTSMAAPHVSGAAALVQQAFPWMSASQLADTVLSTARQAEAGAYDVVAYNPTPVIDDDSHPNADYKWQVNNRQTFVVARPEYSLDQQRYETNVRKEDAAIVFWGDAGSRTDDVESLKKEVAKSITDRWIESQLEDSDFEIDPEAFEAAVRQAADEWTQYFLNNCIVIEYGLGAGLLDAGKAVGGLAQLNVNSMARWDADAGGWTLPHNETGLSNARQLAYTLNLAGDGISRFTNDIVEVGWDPVLHITTEDELNAYNDEINQGKPYEGSSTQTVKPEDADLPISLVVSGTVDDKGTIVSAGTLVMSGHASYRGSTDVVNGATLIVNGIIDGAVNSDATATVGGTGSVGSLVSKGTLSPGDDTREDARIGTLTIRGDARLEAGSSLVLDVAPDKVDQILVQRSEETEEAGTAVLTQTDGEAAANPGLNIVVRTGDYIDHTLRINPADFFPGLAADDVLLEAVREASVTWGGGLTFDFALDDDGYFALHRLDDGMQRVVRSAALSDDALRRAARLDDAVGAAGVLSGPAAELVSWMDAASEKLMATSSDEDRAAIVGEIAATYDAVKPDAHLAFDAAALSRSVRLREVSALRPTADLAASDVVPEATLTVEHADMNKGSLGMDSTRTILSAGARRGYGDWALGWRLGVFYDTVDGKAGNEASAAGIFAAASFVREYAGGLRFFGDAALGYGREDRTRMTFGAGGDRRFDQTVHMASFGASAGLGQKLAADALPLDLMPYVRISWDGLVREGFREGQGVSAQAFDGELLSTAAAEAGLAFSSRRSADASFAGIYFEGRAAYRNRFHVAGDESYEWAGLKDATYRDFLANHHAALVQCALGWQMNSRHDLSLVLDAEKGDEGTERWGVALRWTRRF